MYNGEDAVEIATNLIKKAVATSPKPFKIRPIKMILLDFMMPRMNGI